MQHVVAVADPGDGLACDRPAMLLEGHDVGHDLAGMGVVGQPVDHRDGGVLGQFEQPIMRGGADHDRIDVARQHLGRVGDRLGAAELHFRAGSMIVSPPSWRMPTSKETRVRVEGLSKIIASTLPSSGLVALAGLQPRLAGRGVVQHGAQIAGGNGGQVGEMADTIGHPSDAPAVVSSRRPRPACRDGSGAGPDAVERLADLRRRETVSGGSRRTTLSPAGTASSFWSRSAAIELGVRAPGT